MSEPRLRRSCASWGRSRGSGLEEGDKWLVLRRWKGCGARKEREGRRWWCFGETGALIPRAEGTQLT